MTSRIDARTKTTPSLGKSLAENSSYLCQPLKKNFFLFFLVSSHVFFYFPCDKTCMYIFIACVSSSFISGINWTLPTADDHRSSNGNDSLVRENCKLLSANAKNLHGLEISQREWFFSFILIYNYLFSEISMLEKHSDKYLARPWKVLSRVIKKMKTELKGGSRIFKFPGKEWCRFTTHQYHQLTIIFMARKVELFCTCHATKAMSAGK